MTWAQIRTVTPIRRRTRSRTLVAARLTHGLRPASALLAYVICRIHDHAAHLLRMDDNEAAIGEASEIAQ